MMLQELLRGHCRPSNDLLIRADALEIHQHERQSMLGLNERVALSRSAVSGHP
jgi:hypothetical protein